MLKTDNLTAMQLGRLTAQLEKQYRFSDGSVQSLRAYLESNAPLVKETGDGMIDWNRRRFNRMDGRQQAEYEARLKAKRYYYLNGLQVPKIVYDAVQE